MPRRFIKHPARASSEKGSTLVEFSIAVTVFLIALFSLLEIARMLWTYNAIADGVRQGARFASMNCPNATNAVRNVVVYGRDVPGNAPPIVHGLTANHVTVTYTGLGIRQGSVSVRVSGFVFSFLTLPHVLGGSLTFPAYEISMTGESAGYIPGGTPCG